MNIETIFSFIGILLSIGCIQVSLENILLFVKFPSVLNYPLNNGIVKSKLLKKLGFIYNSPGIWLLAFGRFLVSIGLLFNAILAENNYLYPLLLLLIDVLGFSRWKFMPSSETALQRVILSAIFLHYFFSSSAISLIALAAICTFTAFAYFAAGYKKLKSKAWISGATMKSFAKESKLPFSGKGSWWKYAGYAVILFECCFLFAIFYTTILLPFMIVGILFHLYLYVRHSFSFFFWTFISAYPAVWYVAENLIY